MKNKLLSYVLSIGLAFSTLISYANTPKSIGKLEQIINKTQEVQEYKEETQNKKEISTTELIKLATLESSLDFVNENKENTPFKQQIKKHSLEKTADNLSKSKFYWIDLAEEYVKLNDPNSPIPENGYESVAKQVAIEKENFYKGHTDEKAPNVIKAQAETGKINTDYYIKLIQNNKKRHKKQNIQEQYNNLIRLTFSEKEYSEYCELLCKSMEEYYDELGKTLGWKIIFGKKDIDKMKKATINHYREKRDKIYNRKE